MTENWDSMRLKYAASINPLLDRNVLDTMKDESVPFLPMDRVNEDGTYSTDIEKPLNEVLNGYTAFQESDVIIAKITPCFENGKGAYLDRLYNNIGFGSTEFHVLRSIPGVSIPKFIFYVTRSHPFRNIGEGSMIGSAGQKRVPSSFIENFHLELPRILEQKSIVNFLDKKTSQIDSLIEKKKRLIELLKEYRTAIINHAVTKGLDPNAKMKDSGIEWIGEIPEHWEVKRLKYCDSVIMGQSPISEDYNFDKEGLPFLQGNADFTSLFPEAKIWCNTANKIAKTNDILLSVRAPIGAVNIADREYGIGRGLCAIRTAKTHCKLLFYIALNLNDELNSVGTGSTFTAISTDEVENSFIPQPPPKEQESISNYLDDKCVQIDAAIFKETNQIEQISEYRTSLISDAVTGKIDVRDYAERVSEPGVT